MLANRHLKEAVTIAMLKHQTWKLLITMPVHLWSQVGSYPMG